MREIQQNIKGTILKINTLKGVPLILKINRGRNKIETLQGSIESAYPNIFTFRQLDGNLNSFSYSDILANNIKFFKGDCSKAMHN